ncbi:hypothetical protein ILUMI_18538 [Ignelater luminosus]|uniref:Uncharacterized protein n=1 Tax=Ignelater luminosus TaxID=2038154 RepID=A0A8K0CMC1_IGNLU|nr:hypothetical protein ILUMI_18538 [Ignelater luminosus]
MLEPPRIWCGRVTSSQDAEPDTIGTNLCLMFCRRLPERTTEQLKLSPTSEEPMEGSRSLQTPPVLAALQRHHPTTDIFILPLIIGARGTWPKDNTILLDRLGLPFCLSDTLVKDVIKSSTIIHNEFSRTARWYSASEKPTWGLGTTTHKLRKLHHHVNLDGEGYCLKRHYNQSLRVIVNNPQPKKVTFSQLLALTVPLTLPVDEPDQLQSKPSEPAPTGTGGPDIPSTNCKTFSKGTEGPKETSR